MKKFFYTLFLLVAASMTMTTFVSCEESDDDDVIKKEEVQKEDYLAFKYWISNDVKVSGISALKFNTSLSIDGCPGKVCDLVELTGQQAKDAKFSVKVELKSNWKELIKNKKEFSCADVHVISHDKNADFSFKNLTINISTFDRDGHLGDVLDQAVEHVVPSLGFEYPSQY